MKNNEIVLIGSYCDTQIKLDTLEKQIDSLKLLNLPMEKKLISFFKIMGMLL